MNKVIIEWAVLFEDGAWLTISTEYGDVHCYVPSNVPVFEHDYIRAEGFLSATHMDANKFTAVNITVIKKYNKRTKRYNLIKE